MSDPYRNLPSGDPIQRPPGTNPPRYPADRNANAGLIASIAVIVVLALGLIVWGVSRNETPSAANKTDQTTGQGSNPAPANPKPATPSGANDNPPARTPMQQR